MVNQQQGTNQLESSANILQQPHNFDVQVSLHLIDRINCLNLTFHCKKLFKKLGKQTNISSVQMNTKVKNLEKFAQKF